MIIELISRGIPYKSPPNKSVLHLSNYLSHAHSCLFSDIIWVLSLRFYYLPDTKAIKSRFTSFFFQNLHDWLRASTNWSEIPVLDNQLSRPSRLSNFTCTLGREGNSTTHSDRSGKQQPSRGTEMGEHYFRPDEVPSVAWVLNGSVDAVYLILLLYPSETPVPSLSCRNLLLGSLLCPMACWFLLDSICKGLYSVKFDVIVAGYKWRKI